MLANQKIRTAQVIGPLGESMTLDSLPPPNTTRWVVRRKAEVVAAVAGGLLTVDEACQRYSLSLEEFTGWQRAVDRSGMPGLRVTRIKQYRDQYERQQRDNPVESAHVWDLVRAIYSANAPVLTPKRSISAPYFCAMVSMTFASCVPFGAAWCLLPLHDPAPLPTIRNGTSSGECVLLSLMPLPQTIAE